MIPGDTLGSVGRMTYGLDDSGRLYDEARGPWNPHRSARRTCRVESLAKSAGPPLSHNGRDRHHRRGGDTLVDMLCWCEVTVMAVPSSWVAKGRAGCCGRSKCLRLAGQTAAEWKQQNPNLASLRDRVSLGDLQERARAWQERTRAPLVRAPTVDPMWEDEDDEPPHIESHCHFVAVGELREGRYYARLGDRPMCIAESPYAAIKKLRSTIADDDHLAMGPVLNALVKYGALAGA